MQDGTASHNYKFKFGFIYLDGNNLVLSGSSLIMNSQIDDKFNKVNIGSNKILIGAKQYSQAYFTNDYNFHFFTYNDVSDFLGGYSTSGVNSNDYSNKSK